MRSREQLAGLLVLLLLAACGHEVGIAAKGRDPSAGVDASELAETVRSRIELRDQMIEDLTARVLAANERLEELRGLLVSRSDEVPEGLRENWQQVGLNLGKARRAALDKIDELRGLHLEHIEKQRASVQMITRFLDNETAKAGRLFARG